MLKPNVIPCKDAGEVFEAIERFQIPPYGWIFRGQREAHWTLQPWLERRVTVSEIGDAELRMTSEFRSKAHLYTDVLPRWDDIVSWLAAMQHHGIPTRLLDWTYSPHVALFFALSLEERDPAQKGDSAVWAVNFLELDRTARAVSHELFEFPREVRFEDSHRFRSMAFASDPDTGRWNTTFIDHRDRGLVVPLLPEFQSLRLSSQQGLFLLNCNFQITFENSLSAMLDESGQQIQKITFPCALHPQLLRRLMQINIHPVSMFPDIGGLASFIALKLRLF